MSVEVNKYGVNKAIKSHLLSDEEMKKVGFTNQNKEYWYFYRDLGNEISFNVKIYLKDLDNPNIEIIDEDYCQHYDYQRYLKNIPENEFVIKIRDKVEYWMEYLQSNGVLSGHVKGEYI